MIEATITRIRGISQVLGPYDAECPDCGQRSAFRPIQFVGLFMDSNQLALLAARQIQPACGNVARIARPFIPLARVMSRTAAAGTLGPAITLARIVNVTWIHHGSSYTSGGWQEPLRRRRVLQRRGGTGPEPAPRMRDAV